jgi:hypothetical protein
MSSYTDLDVYKLTHELGVSIHKLTLQLPKYETLEWLKYLEDCHPELKENVRSFVEQAKTLGRKLNSFIQAVEKQHQTSKS